MIFCLFLGRHETTLDTLDFTTAFSTEHFVPEGNFESNTTEGSFESNVTIDTSDENISKVLKTYRAVVIPIGLFISCIFAFVTSVKYVYISLQRIEDSLDKIVYNIQF